MEFTTEQRIAIYQKILDWYDEGTRRMFGNCLSLCDVICALYDKVADWWTVHEMLPEFNAFRNEVAADRGRGIDAYVGNWFGEESDDEPNPEYHLARQIILELSILDANGEI